MVYFLCQVFPILLLDVSSLRAFRLMRNADSRTTRTAELRRRRLLDFVSPSMLSMAGITYIAFILLIAYVRRFDFPWFGGYLNVVGVTAVNLCFANLLRFEWVPGVVDRAVFLRS